MLQEKKYIRRINKPFMIKTLSKSIMVRTPFRNRFLKNLTGEYRLLAFARRRNFCVSLLRKEKNKILQNYITDNRKFWQIVRPFHSEKNKSREKITLLKNTEIISDEVELENILNTFFQTQ